MLLKEALYCMLVTCDMLVTIGEQAVLVQSIRVHVDWTIANCLSLVFIRCVTKSSWELAGHCMPQPHLLLACHLTNHPVDFAKMGALRDIALLAAQHLRLPVAPAAIVP